MTDMEISTFKVGFLKCNCYLLGIDDDYLIIDPGDDWDEIKSNICDKHLIGVLLTHIHFDHTACVSNLVSYYNTCVFNVSNLKEGKNRIGKFNFEVIYTPGHTLDCVSYYFYEDKLMFTGDFLFRGTIGRCDLIESDYSLMRGSIDKIKGYGGEIVIYPGHGDISTLGYEFRNNPYFN